MIKLFAENKIFNKISKSFCIFLLIGIFILANLNMSYAADCYNYGGKVVYLNGNNVPDDDLPNCIEKGTWPGAGVVQPVTYNCKYVNGKYIDKVSGQEVAVAKCASIEGAPGLPSGSGGGVLPTPATPAVPAAPVDNSSYTLLEPLGGGATTTYTIEKEGLSKYLTDITRYFFMIVAIIAAFYLIYGGIQYLTTDMSSLKLEGKETIKRVIVGLIFIFSIWTVFNAINPDLLRSAPDFGSIEKESPTGDAGTATPSPVTPTVPGQVTPPPSALSQYCTSGLETVQGNYQMCSTVAGKMRDMIAKAASENVTLTIVSAYRSAPSCAVTTGTCARNISNHQKGLAVDFGGGFKSGPATNPTYVWLVKNANSFGFYNTLIQAGYKDEYNHWSTTGR